MRYQNAIILSRYNLWLYSINFENWFICKAYSELGPIVYLFVI